jgi:hypothetical protein
MRSRKFTFKLGAAALACTAMSLASSQAQAAEYWLKAGATTVEMPNPNPPPLPAKQTITVPMWGYANCTDNSYGTGANQSCTPITVPGPALAVGALDSSGLTVHLKNTLAMPTSLVINGLIKPMSPVWSDGTSGPRFANVASPSPAELLKRVRSFDVEAPATIGEATYTWANVNPGTYLYQSGTQPQVQVQMGLYGAATKNATDAAGNTPAQAYSGVAFNSQATLLYSEIDPALHTAIDGGSYGTAPAPTSTLNYTPKYFLINGHPFPNGTPVIPAAGTTLLRLLNAGLTTHVPMIQGTHWTVVAEDGKPYPYRRTQYTALLPAAKTMDVLVTPDSGGAVYPVLDRRLSLSNNGLSEGGMLAFLKYDALGVVGASGTADGNVAPIADPDSYNSIFGVTLNVGPVEGVLANDHNTDGLPLPIKAVAASGPTTGGGTYTLNTNGSFIYEPLAGYSGATDSFSYQVTDGKALAVSPATVTINLSAPIAPTLASLDTFTRAAAPALGGNWNQQATSTSGKDVGVSAGETAVATATAVGGLATWNAASFGTIQGAGATLSADAYLVLKATGPNPDVPVNYVRVGCEADQIVVSTSMGGSNVTVHAKQAAFGTCAATGNNLSAMVDAKGLVTVFKGGTYAGGVQLPDVTAWKGGGRIGIQLTAVGASADDFAGGTLP